MSFGNGKSFTRIKPNKTYVVEFVGSSHTWLIEPYAFDIKEVGTRKYQGAIRTLAWLYGSRPKPNGDELWNIRISASDIISIREARPSEV